MYINYNYIRKKTSFKKLTFATFIYTEKKDLIDLSKISLNQINICLNQINFSLKQRN